MPCVVSGYRTVTVVIASGAIPKRQASRPTIHAIYGLARLRNRKPLHMRGTIARSCLAPPKNIKPWPGNYGTPPVLAVECGAELAPASPQRADCTHHADEHQRVRRRLGDVDCPAGYDLHVSRVTTEEVTSQIYTVHR